MDAWFGWDTGNPCVKRCGFEGGVCRGCLRTREEVRSWKRLPELARAEINRRIRAEGAARKAAKSDRKAAKRRKKLDRKIRRLQKKLDALRVLRAGLEPGPGASDMMSGVPGRPGREDRPHADRHHALSSP